MLTRFRSPWVWGGGVVAVLIVIFVVVASAGGGDDADGDEIQNIDRSPDSPIVIPPEEPIIVGVSTALTGPVGDRGSEYLDAVLAGIEHWRETNGDLIAGHEIEVRAEDDGCSEADIATTAARRLLGRPGLVGVIGPQCSAGVAVAAPIYTDAGVVAISGSATATDLTTGQSRGSFFFRTAYRNDLEGSLIALFIVERLQADTVYLIDDGGLFSVDLARSTQRQTQAAGAGVRVIRESIEVGDVDFSDLAARIAEDDPDFVGFTGFNPEAGLLLRQIRDAGYDGLFGAGDAAASQEDFADPLGAAAEGALFAGCQYPLTEHLLDDFVAVHGQAPSATFAAQYADAAIALLDAVKEVAQERPDDGSLTFLPTALRDALRATTVEDGFSGSFAFDVNGDRVPEPGDLLSEVQDTAFATRSAQILLDLGLIRCQVQDGEIVPLDGPTARDIRL